MNAYIKIHVPMLLHGSVEFMHLHASVQLGPTCLHPQSLLTHPFEQPHDVILRQVDGIAGNVMIQ